MKKQVKQINLKRENGNVDNIIFNDSQQKYFNAILNPDFTINLDNQFKEFAFYGGYRAGKSFIQQLIIYLICITYPDVRCVYVRNSYNELKDTVIKQFNDTFLHYGSYNYVESSKDGSHIARFNNGSEIRFRSADEPTKLLSAEYDLIALCQGEKIPREVVQILIGRWSGTRLPKKLFLNEGNPAWSWVKTEYADKTKAELEAKQIFFLRCKTHENLHNIDPEYIEDFKSKNSELDYRRFIEGEFIGNEDIVFHQFSEINIIPPIDIKEIPYTCKKGIGGDYGQRHLSTFVWAYKHFDGRIIIYDSWGKSRVDAKEIATAGLKYGKMPCIYDYSCKERDRYGVSEWDRINAEGLALSECSKQDEAGLISHINSLLKQQLLYITSNNEELLWEINNWKYPPKKIGSEIIKETPIDANNDYIDAMKYIIRWLEPIKVSSPWEDKNKNSYEKLVRSKPRMNIMNLG